MFAVYAVVYLCSWMCILANNASQHHPDCGFFPSCCQSHFSQEAWCVSQFCETAEWTGLNRERMKVHAYGRRPSASSVGQWRLTLTSSQVVSTCTAPSSRYTDQEHHRAVTTPSLAKTVWWSSENLAINRESWHVENNRPRRLLAASVELGVAFNHFSDATDRRSWSATILDSVNHIGRVGQTHVGWAP